MSFFTNFPVVKYYFSEKDPNEYTLRHIIRRFKVDELVKKNVLTYQNYLISEGDSPDVVAYKYYGRPDWHWIVLMYNDIINPLVDWPRSSKHVMDEAISKYFVTRTATFTMNSINIVVNDVTGIQVGATIKGIGVPDDLVVVWITDKTLKTNLVSTFSGVKTVKIDTVLNTHHIVNSKGIIVDSAVYQGTDISYVRNIDYEHALNDRHRLIKMPLREHAQRIEIEAASILKGT